MITIFLQITFLILIHTLEASSEGRVKIESCAVSVFNTVDELVKLEHKTIQGELLIHLFGNITQIQGRPISQRTLSVFMPGNAETVIDYDCVPSYSQILAAQIVNMNDNVIIPHTSLKSDYHYSLRKHQNGYFYVLKNQTLAKTTHQELKRDKQEIQRLKRALKVTRHNNVVYREMVENQGRKFNSS